MQSISLIVCAAWAPATAIAQTAHNQNLTIPAFFG